MTGSTNTSALPYGTAAQGQGLFATSTTAGVWAYSPWDSILASAAAGTPAGTTPPTPVVGTGSTPIRGSVTFGTGSNSSTGVQCTVTFGATLPSTPTVVAVPNTSATAAKSFAVTAVSTTTFSVSLTAPTDSQANTVYGFNYYTCL
jgi:hypothetical protein